MVASRRIPVKIVRVEWLDSESRSTDTWTFRDEFQEFADEALGPIASTGLLWADTNEYIVLVQSVSPFCISGYIKIPKVAITARDEIGEMDVPDEA
jgi:hypothetical protein